MMEECPCIIPVLTLEYLLHLLEELIPKGNALGLIIKVVEVLRRVIKLSVCLLSLHIDIPQFLFVFLIMQSSYTL